jgi:hypothetical protein
MAGFNYMAVPLCFHIVPAAVEACIVLDERFCFVLREVRVLCYQPSCQNCFSVVFLLRSVVTKIWLQHWKHMITAE